MLLLFFHSLTCGSHTSDPPSTSGLCPWQWSWSCMAWADARDGRKAAPAGEAAPARARLPRPPEQAPVSTPWPAASSTPAASSAGRDPRRLPTSPRRAHRGPASPPRDTPVHAARRRRALTGFFFSFFFHPPCSSTVWVERRRGVLCPDWIRRMAADADLGGQSLQLAMACSTGRGRAQTSSHGWAPWPSAGRHRGLGVGWCGCLAASAAIAGVRPDNARP